MFGVRKKYPKTPQHLIVENVINFGKSTKIPRIRKNIVIFVLKTIFQLSINQCVLSAINNIKRCLLQKIKVLVSNAPASSFSLIIVLKCCHKKKIIMRTLVRPDKIPIQMHGKQKTCLNQNDRILAFSECHQAVP